MIGTERVGFEPTVEFPLHTLSKRAPSTTRTSLRICRINGLRASGSAQNPNCVRNCVRPPNVLRSLRARGPRFGRGVFQYKPLVVNEPPEVSIQPAVCVPRSGHE